VKAIKTSNTAFCFILLTLLIIGSFAFNAQELATTDNCLIAHASYDPLTVIANITLDKTPHCIAVNEETNRVYVGVTGGIVIINGETDQIITEIPLYEVYNWTEVRAIAVNPQTNRVYVGVWLENITVIDGATNLKVGEIPEDLENAFSLAVDPLTNRVYVGFEPGFMGSH